MRKQHHIEILKQYLKTSPRKLELVHKWAFQMDSDPNRTTTWVTKRLMDNKINVLEWPSQSSDLNAIENLWAELKRHPQARKPTNQTHSHQLFQEEWDKVSADCFEMWKDTQKVWSKLYSLKTMLTNIVMKVIKNFSKNDFSHYSGI